MNFPNLHKKLNSSIESIKSFQVKPSLRYIIEDEGHNHNFLKVTPDFQEYVAKHLFNHLESQIVEKKKKRKNMPENGDEKKGIRLFNSSTLLMGDVSFAPKYKPHKRKKHCNSDDEKLIRSRASETAVSPQQILNREEVKFWAKETKGKIVKVRPNKEGTFDVINDIS
ncbi:uncharacterized protein LOC126895991 isoform X2 [Daktulosphaira vitifoliae]|uniref:uncharacterized protein LOC126895991 isoform X2 n=1 Tax=Daktulosphaira vitifoliae TaxID=58002 RepID=UPI0021A98CA5|nr:uncharacterized protein LOC126895991 isoform X2 [Daktulosphaira vitifoliae]